MSLRLFAVAFWLGVVAVGVPSRTQPRRKPRPGFRRETATKADSFAGVNRYSRQIARISLLAIPAGVCWPWAAART
ncbi:hypothetical protein ACPA9J_14275 [Pseudomonas aeruginosa]